MSVVGVVDLDLDGDGDVNLAGHALTLRRGLPTRDGTSSTGYVQVAVAVKVHDHAPDHDQVDQDGRR